MRAQLRNTLDKKHVTRATELVYRFCSQRYIILFVSIATAAMIAHVALRVDSFVLNVKGSNTLATIISRADELAGTSIQDADLPALLAEMRQAIEDSSTSAAPTSAPSASSLGIKSTPNRASASWLSSPSTTPSASRPVLSAVAPPVSGTSTSSMRVSAFDVAASRPMGGAPVRPPSSDTDSELADDSGELGDDDFGDDHESESGVKLLLRLGGTFDHSQASASYRQTLRERGMHAAAGLKGYHVRAAKAGHEGEEKSLDLQPGLPLNASLVNATVTASAIDGQLYILPISCAYALVEPFRILVRLHRTDVAVIVYQIWLWGLLIWGLWLESVPHLVAVLAGHLIDIVFAGLSVTTLNSIHDKFDKAVTGKACEGANVLPNFWTEVTTSGIVDLSVECAALLILTFLAYKVYYVLDWRTFKKLGASRKVRLAHTFAMVHTILLQLNAYFVITFQAMWLTELFNHAWRSETLKELGGFKVVLLVMISLTLPWLILGSLAQRYASRLGMVVYIGFDLALLIVDLFLLSGKYYQEATRNWVFLSVLGYTSSLLLFASLIIAVLCMVTAHHLNSVFPVDERRAISEGSAPDEKSNILEIVAFPGEVAVFSVQTNPWQRGAAVPVTAPKGRSAVSARSGAPTPDGLPPAYKSQGLAAVRMSRADTMASWTVGDEAALVRPAGARTRPPRAMSERTYSSVSYSTTSVGSSVP